MPGTAHTSTGRYAYIDALRGIAALAVLVYHIFLHFGSQFSRGLLVVTEQGARGVQLFYVLSAFTLFLSLQGREAKGKRSFRAFFVRRFFS